MTTCIICGSPFAAKNRTVITCGKACSAARKKQRTDAYNALTAERRRQGGVGNNGRREGDDEAVRRACRKGDAAYAAALEKAGFGRVTVQYRAANFRNDPKIQTGIDTGLFSGSPAEDAA